MWCMRGYGASLWLAVKASEHLRLKTVGCIDLPACTWPVITSPLALGSDEWTLSTEDVPLPQSLVP